MDDLRAVYNKIAADWGNDHESDTWWIEGTDKFISLLPSGSGVLDVGCGSGVKSEYIVQKGLTVVGIDFSEEMVKLAAKRVPVGEFLVVDIRDMSKLNRTFDGILAQAVLLHIPKKEVAGVLGGLKEKLKSGGCLYVAVKERRPGKPEEEIVTENDYGYEYSRFFSYFTLDEVKEQLRTAGMSIKYENITTSGRTNWIQVIGQA
ncbi:MAG: hypothetical protein RL681_501 [Candidatus Parcubacteria bacterium]|jgi:2-polyprenyl-3-methyl-5-hydroxy-6-metoxy-1,4-benzoquinol methylase